MNGKMRILSAAAAVLTALSVSSCADAKKYDEYNYDLADYVKVGQYKGVVIQDESKQVTDEMIANQVLVARANFAEASEKDSAAAMTDQVNIDFVGYIDGELFDGGSAEDYDLTLGSGAFIDGFEEGLVGVKRGETVTLELSFPDPYLNDLELSGKPVRFDVTVNHVFEQILPEYTDEFVLVNYGYATIRDFETALRNELEDQYENENLYSRISQVWIKILDEAEVLQMPEEEYNARMATYREYYTSLAEEEGISLNEYAAKTMDMNVQELEEWLDDEVSAAVKEEMVLYYIARTEDLKVSDEEYQNGAMEYASYYGLTSVAELEAYFDPKEIRQTLLFDKVLEFLADNAVTEVTANGQ